MNSVAYEQERRASVVFPGYRPFAMNKCFIFIALVLLVLKNPNNYVVSDMKGIKDLEIIYSSFTKAPYNMVVQRNSLLMGPITTGRNETLKYCYFIFI